MKRNLMAAAMIGVLATAGAAIAQNNGSASTTSGSQGESMVQGLITANLAEAGMLHAQLPYLAGSGLTGTWDTMIREHRETVRVLARSLRSMGGTPDMHVPAPHVMKASPRAIFDDVFQAHVDTLEKVKGMAGSASSPAVKKDAHIVADTVRHHLALLGAQMLRRGWWNAGGAPNRFMARSRPGQGM